MRLQPDTLHTQAGISHGAGAVAAARLSPPLGLGRGASSTDVLRFVFDLDIPLLNGRVPFQRTAYELVRRCSGAEIPEGILKDQVGAHTAAATCWLGLSESVASDSCPLPGTGEATAGLSRQETCNCQRQCNLPTGTGLLLLFTCVDM